MSDKSPIEWTDATWNPIRGCSKVSEGCRNCYAIKTAHRFHGAGEAFEGLTEATPAGLNWTGKVMLVPELLDKPLRWKRPRRIFVNSMSDLFHPEVPTAFIEEVFAIMAVTPHHTYQILTKRPERMLEWFTDRRAGFVAGAAQQMGYRHLLPQIAMKEWWPLKNVWIGVSVENQRAADERIPLLLQTPAAVRFLSCEPLLGTADLSRYMWPLQPHWPSPYRSPEEAKAAGAKVEYKRQGLVRAGSYFLDWVIAGGESGPGARPMHPDWARSLRDQCQAAGVPFFFKQWGEWAEANCGNVDLLSHKIRLLGTDGTDHNKTPSNEVPDDAVLMGRIGKHAAGRQLDGRTWDDFPEVRS